MGSRPASRSRPKCSGPDRSDELDELVDRQKSLRKIEKLVFEAFRIQSFRPNDPILASVNLLRALHRGRPLPHNSKIRCARARFWKTRVWEIDYRLLSLRSYLCARFNEPAHLSCSSRDLEERPQMLEAHNNDRRLFNDAADSGAIDEQCAVPDSAPGRAGRMSSTSSARARDLMSFGPFLLSATERLLTRDGVRIDLGARALDILICLLSRPSEVFSKQELLARVWPDVIVEEGSLRFQVARLRKALGDGVDGARYIVTLAGRGYCFVAAMSPTQRSASTNDQSSIASDDDLGTRLTRTIESMTETDAIAALPVGSCTVMILQFSEDSKTAVILPLLKRWRERERNCNPPDRAPGPEAL